MNRVYWMESKMELRKMARMKQYSLSTVLFPLMFYCFFGLAMASSTPGAASMSKYLLATFGAFGVMGATLYAFGAGVAVERGLGWLEVKRASPMPPAKTRLGVAKPGSERQNQARNGKTRLGAVRSKNSELF